MAQVTKQILFAIYFLLSSSAFAQETGDVLMVTSASAVVYRTPDASQKTSSVLKNGRRIEAAGTAINGFVPLATKSGGRVWVRVADVAPDAPKDKGHVPVIAPAAAASTAPKPPPADVITDEEGLRARLGLYELTFDVGIASGNYQNAGYAEFDIGLNSFFNRYFAWRNAIFGRFPQGPPSAFGLDTSARLVLDSGLIGLFLGPGYRIATASNSAPFAEAGIGVKVGGVTVGVGTKILFDSVIYSGQANDTQYFVILSAGGEI